MTSFTLSSDSGTDWTHPVPEPSSLLLLSVGAAIAFRRIKSRIRKSYQDGSVEDLNP